MDSFCVLYYDNIAWWLSKGAILTLTNSLPTVPRVAAYLVYSICYGWHTQMIVNFYVSLSCLFRCNHLLIGPLAVTIVDVLIWHAADVTTQLFCIGVTVCRPLYKDWLYRVADHIESVSNPAGDTKQDSTYGARKAPDLIALRTIGGSAVKPASDGAASDKQRGSVAHSSRHPSSTLRRSLVFQSDARNEEFVMPIARMSDLEKAVSSGGRQHR